MLDSYGVSIDSSPMAFYALMSGIQKVDQLLNNPVLLLSGANCDNIVLLMHHRIPQYLSGVSGLI